MEHFPDDIIRINHCYLFSLMKGYGQTFIISFHKSRKDIMN